MGFTSRLSRKGQVAVDDDFQLLQRNEDGITISEMNLLFVREKNNQDLLRKAIATAALPEDWREYFAERLRRPAVAR